LRGKNIKTQRLQTLAQAVRACRNSPSSVVSKLRFTDRKIPLSIVRQNAHQM